MASEAEKSVGTNTWGSDLADNSTYTTSTNHDGVYYYPHVACPDVNAPEDTQKGTVFIRVCEKNGEKAVVPVKFGSDKEGNILLVMPNGAKMKLVITESGILEAQDITKHEKRIPRVVLPS